MNRLLLAALFVIGLAGAANAQDISGRYRLEGKNPDGSAYSGTALIVVKNRNICTIERQLTTSFVDGICMLRDNRLAASFLQGDNVGVAFYELRPDGSLSGRWTIVEKNGFGSEILTPQR